MTLPARGSVLEIGRGRVVREGTTIALLSLGARLQECLKAADELAALRARRRRWRMRASPSRWTPRSIERLAREHEVLITIEEGAIGGFGSQVLHHLAQRGLLDHGLKVRPMVLPDRFIDHDAPGAQYDAGRPHRPPHHRHRARRPGHASGAERSAVA